MFQLSLISPIVIYCLDSLIKVFIEKKRRKKRTIKNTFNQKTVCFILIIIITIIFIVIGLLLLLPLLISRFIYHLPILPQEVASLEFNSIAELKHSIIYYHYATDQYLLPFSIGLIVGYCLLVKLVPSSPTSQYNKPIISLFTNANFIRHMTWIILGLLLAAVIYWNEQFLLVNSDILDEQQQSQTITSTTTNNYFIICNMILKVVVSSVVGWFIYDFSGQ